MCPGRAGGGGHCGRRAARPRAGEGAHARLPFQRRRPGRAREGSCRARSRRGAQPAHRGAHVGGGRARARGERPEPAGDASRRARCVGRAQPSSAGAPHPDDPDRVRWHGGPRRHRVRQDPAAAGREHHGPFLRRARNVPSPGGPDARGAAGAQAHRHLRRGAQAECTGGLGVDKPLHRGSGAQGRLGVATTGDRHTAGLRPRPGPAGPGHIHRLRGAPARDQVRRCGRRIPSPPPCERVYRRFFRSWSTGARRARSASSCLPA